MHDDTEIIEDDGTEGLVLAGESIIVYTDMGADKLDGMVNCKWLCLDGVIASKLACKENNGWMERY